MFLSKKNKKGAVALVTLMIISSSLLIGGVTLILNTIDLSRSIKNYRSISVIEIYSNSCLEESLFKLSQNTLYTGTISLSDQDLSCQAVVADHSNPSIKTISLSSNDGEYFFTQDRTVNISVTPIELID